MLQERQIIVPFYRQSQQRRKRLEKIEQLLIDIHEQFNTMTEENRKLIGALEFNSRIDWIQKKLARL